MKSIVLAPVFAALISLSLGAATADIVITVGDDVPGTDATPPSYTTDVGTIVRDSAIDIMPLEYTVSDLDLTSEGGGTAESFVFRFSFTATGGNPLFNDFGNVAVDGGTTDQQVETTETLTTTVSLVSSTFDGLSLDGFTTMRFGGFGNTETADLTHGGGTISAIGTEDNYDISGTSFTITPTSDGAALNVRAFQATFTATAAIPEPASFGVLIGLGLCGITRRRRK